MTLCYSRVQILLQPKLTNYLTQTVLALKKVPSYFWHQGGFFLWNNWLFFSLWRPLKNSRGYVWWKNVRRISPWITKDSYTRASIPWMCVFLSLKKTCNFLEQTRRLGICGNYNWNFKAEYKTIEVSEVLICTIWTMWMSQNELNHRYFFVRTPWY